MVKSIKNEDSELENRLKELKRTQRRIDKEIELLARKSAKSSGTSSGRRRRSASSSSSAGSGSHLGSTIEMRSYLSSGSFKTKAKMRHERSVQRNKAIFMTILAILAIYMFFAWIF